MPKCKEIEIVASFSGKISTGKFENEQPFYSLREVWTDAEDNFIQTRQKELEEMCYARFLAVEERSVIERIRAQRADMRFYTKDGKQYPSVTSILNWDADMYVAPAQLVQYAARGTILHRQAEIYMLTSQWIEPKDIPELHAEYVIVTKGDLQLKLDDVDFRGFWDKYKMEPIETELILFNNEYRYAGRSDLFAIYEGKPTMIDLKTGASIDRTKAFKQIAAYAKCMPIQPEQLMVVHLNNKVKQGFSQPIITDKVEEYFQLFLKDREAFTARFGI
jgi:hypothetical protein